WKRKIDYHLQASDKSFIHVLTQVGRENGYAVVLFHLLQEIANLDVRVTIVRVLHLRALAKQGVRFIEDQNRVRALRLVEELMQVLFRLADVFAHDLRQIDLVQIQPQLSGDDFGSHRLAGSGGTGEQDIQSTTERQLLFKTPVAVDDVPVSGLHADLAQLRKLIVGKNYLAPLLAR